MPLMVSAGEMKSYTPAPEGTHQAVCVDIIDKGLMPNPFKDNALQRKVDIVWQIDEPRDDGTRHLLYKRYTMSLHEKASLNHDLNSWRGKPFTEAELKGFDLMTILGANCLLNVQHKKSADGTRTYANVLSVMPLLKGMAKLAPAPYERKVDPAQAPVTEFATDAREDVDEQGFPLTVADIPFGLILALVSAAGMLFA